MQKLLFFLLLTLFTQPGLALKLDFRMIARPISTRAAWRPARQSRRPYGGGLVGD